MVTSLVRNDPVTRADKLIYVELCDCNIGPHNYGGSTPPNRLVSKPCNFVFCPIQYKKGRTNDRWAT